MNKYQVVNGGRKFGETKNPDAVSTLYKKRMQTDTCASVEILVCSFARFVCQRFRKINVNCEITKLKQYTHTHTNDDDRFQIKQNECVSIEESS